VQSNNINDTSTDAEFNIQNRSSREVAAIIGVPQYVLRFWESKFSNIIVPTRSKNRRYYSEEDVMMLEKIRHLLHDQGYTIKGVQNLFQSDSTNKKPAKQKEDNNMTDTLEQTRPMQTQLESLVMAASSEILKNNYQNLDRDKLTKTLSKLINIRERIKQSLEK